MTLLILYAALALGISFLCSVLEAVLLSLTPSYVASLQNRTPKMGDKLMRLKTDIDRPLAAILSLNTIAHTVGAAGVGAQAQVVFGDASLAITSGVLTLLILVTSEIIPKTLGATHWKKLAPWMARVLAPLMLLMAPLVGMSRLLARVIGPKHRQSSVDREEFAALVDIAMREGLLDENEAGVLRNVLYFGKLRGKDVMTPRTVIVAFDENERVGLVADQQAAIPFSRFPVYSDQIDNVTGYVLKNDVLACVAQDRHDATLADFKREMLALPATTSMTHILKQMLLRKEHVALLLDEYGGVEGLLTLEDVLETMLGLEIVDETDQNVDMQALARHRWARSARQRGVILGMPELPRRGDPEPAPSS